VAVLRVPVLLPEMNLDALREQARGEAYASHGVVIKTLGQWQSLALLMRDDHPTLSAPATVAAINDAWLTQIYDILRAWPLDVAHALSAPQWTVRLCDYPLPDAAALGERSRAAYAVAATASRIDRTRRAGHLTTAEGEQLARVWYDMSRLLEATRASQAAMVYEQANWVESGVTYDEYQRGAVRACAERVRRLLATARGGV